MTLLSDFYHDIAHFAEIKHLTCSFFWFYLWVGEILCRFYFHQLEIFVIKNCYHCIYGDFHFCITSFRFTYCITALILSYILLIMWCPDHIKYCEMRLFLLVFYSCNAFPYWSKKFIMILVFLLYVYGDVYSVYWLYDI